MFRRLHTVALSTVALAVVASGVVMGFSQEPVTTDTPSIVSASALAEAHEEAATTRSTDRESIESAAAARSAGLSTQDAAITARETEVLLQNRSDEQAAVTESLAKEEKRLAEEAKRQEFIDENGYAPDVTDPKEIARQMAANKFGWGDSQFACYNNIIMRESKWDVYADNPTSSAYGIPQALPGSRMASEGSDWKTNPATQIRWGLKYVRDRYGSPCSAWSFKAAHGWY